MTVLTACDIACAMCGGLARSQQVFIAEGCLHVRRERRGGSSTGACRHSKCKGCRRKGCHHSTCLEGATPWGLGLAPMDLAGEGLCLITASISSTLHANWQGMT